MLSFTTHSVEYEYMNDGRGDATLDGSIMAYARSDDAVGTDRPGHLNRRPTLDDT